jgi:hypothetical protein
MPRPPPPGTTPPLPGDELKPGPAASTVVSLSQVLLAPLDAIFKAQVHAARSFVNQVLQLSYPPRDGFGPGATPPAQPPEGSVQPVPASPGAPGPGDMYVQKFQFTTEGEDGRRVPRQVEIPILALVPVYPLRVQEAQFSLRMTVSHVGRHRQVRKKERDKVGEDPPWYLVDEPISVRGVIAPRAPGEDVAAEEQQASSIEIHVKVGAAPVPAALDQLLTTLSQNTTVVSPSNGSTGAGGGKTQ